MTTARIQPLPIQLANQIAAGEVIERPASVVKELLENSIDAGATEISITIEGAGNKLIRVVDNGVGIHQDDLRLALARHATSKLLTSAQLSHIASLGFRGEALPSISSVSDLRLSSRQAEAEHGWQVYTDTISPVAHPVGTTLEVRDLFFNLPARRHFLRSDKTEQSHILTMLQRLALSRFDIAFRYQFGSQPPVNLPAVENIPEEQAKRIAKICGNAFLKQALYLTQQLDDLELKGWLSTAHRAQNDAQYFFINGRVIRDRVIMHAVRQAFAEHIPAGRHPAYVLYLTLPLTALDINVHPTKHEVRFRDARRIHGFITRCLQEAMQSAPAADVAYDATAVRATGIAERTATYHAPQSAHTHLAETVFGRLTSLLHQRYVIAQTATQSGLIDVAQVDVSQRKQQLIAEIAAGSVHHRPLLVPLPYKVNQAEINLIAAAYDLLTTVGIQLTVTAEQTVLLQHFPSLLAQADIAALIADIVQSLTQASAGPKELETVLVAHIRPQVIRDITHATQILQGFQAIPPMANWYVALEIDNLTALLKAKKP